MNEEDTFEALRRVPFEEALRVFKHYQDNNGEHLLSMKKDSEALKEAQEKFRTMWDKETGWVLDEFHHQWILRR